MTVTKFNGFRAPYRSTTFQQQSDSWAQTNGLISMDGVVSQDGSNVVIPPYKFIQNGLIVGVDVVKNVAMPTMEAPFYITVSAPTSSPVDDLSYQFAKAPTDISSNEVIIAAYDGLEWRMFPFINVKAVYDQIKKDRVDFDATGPKDGLYTSENGLNYDTEPGTLIDPTGEVKVLTTTRSYPQIGDDPDWGRVDRVVYRRPLDAEQRIGERMLLKGGTYDTAPVSLYETASHDSSAPREKIKTVIASDNTAHMFVASGYGDTWAIMYSKWSSDRQTEDVAPVSVAVATSKHFDVVIDKNDEIHLIFISSGDVYWKKLDATGLDAGGPIQVDSQTNDCNYPTITTDPHSSRVYIAYSSLITTNQNNLFFATLSLAGDTMQAATQLTTGSTNHIRPHLHVTEDLWVYLAYESAADGKIYYKVMDDVGAEIKALESVSGNTTRIGVGTLVDIASHPKIAVSDNKKVFITFIQDKGGATFGISIWEDGEAFMQELVDPSESFQHYDMFLDSTFNGVHLILARLANIDYVKLEGQEVIFTLPLQAAGASSVSTTQDGLGSMFHAWSAGLAGTFTNYDTGLLFAKTGPQLVSGVVNDVILQDTDMLLASILPSQPPKKGDGAEVSGSSGGLNDGSYLIDAVELVSLDGTNDMYKITMTTSFPALEVGAPTVDLGVPDGNASYFEKSTSETKENAFRKSALASDILLARIVRPGPGILNYFVFSPALGPDHYLPHGTEVSLDWSFTVPDNLTIGNDLEIYDMLNVVNFSIDNGSYPMNEGDCLYVVLDESLPSITPQVTALNSIPFSQNMRVLGAVINGYFNPYLLSIGGVGVLDPNEQVIIGEDVPVELRSKLGFISETEIEAYSFNKGIDQTQTYPKVMGDLSLIAEQNTFVKLIKGQVSWAKPDTNTLEFVTEAFLQIPELAEVRNRIAPQAIVLASDGDVAWVKLNREAGALADLTVTVSAIADVDLDGSANRDVFIIARRTGTDLIINGSRLLPASSKDLDSDLTIENKALLGAGVTEATATPTWGTRGAPQRNINDSEGILEAITSLDIELDKFFGQLRIIAHETDLDKVRVTGVDLTMKDGSILSQEISSLLMKFEGAVLDFTTGEVFESDGLTSLGIDFTPTTLLDTEFSWYSVSIVSSGTNANNTMNIQFLVVPGVASVDEASAEFPVFAGQKKLGSVLVTNNAGSIERSKIRQLGVGSGSGGGGGATGKLIEGGVWTNGTADVWADNGQVNQTYGYTVTSGRISGSSITLPDDVYEMTSLTIGLARALNPTEGKLSLYAVDGGDPTKPTGSALYTTEVVAVPGPDYTTTEVTFPFAVPVPMLPAGRYFVVLEWTTGSGFLRLGNFGDIPGENTVRSSDGGTTWDTYENRSPIIRYTYAVEGLSWGADAYISRPGLTNDRNTVEAGSVVIADGQAAYVYLNSLPGTTDILAVSVDSIENISQYNPSVFILARGVSDGIIVGSSFKLILGQSKELDAGLSIENRALLGSGVTEATSDPDYSGRGAPLRTITDSEKILEGMASIDIEIDKFFGQLRLKAHATDAFKAVVTGVDLVMKDGAVLSQEISNLVMSFEGAVINFSTGVILKANEVDPLGNNFTPTTLLDTEFAWYSVSLISDVTDANNRMTVKLSVVPGAAAADEATAVIPGFAGQTKIGQVLITKVGVALETSKLRQLGASGGGGGGGGGGTGGKLISGGDWKLAGTVLSWSADAYVSNPGLTNGRNTIPAGNATLADGQAVYTILNPLPGVDATVPVTVADIESISPYTPNLYVFGWNKGGTVYVGHGGNALTDGKTKKLDVSGDADKQDKNLKLVEGGEWVFSAGDLSWSANAFVQIEGMVNTRNRILAGSQAIADGEVIYVNVNREPGVDADLTINVDAIENIPDNNLNALIIARRIGDEVYVGTGTTNLRLEESTELDRANLLVTKGKLLGGGDWEVVDSVALQDNGITAFVGNNGSGETFWRGQSMTLSESTTILSVFFRLQNGGGGATGNYTAKIWASNGSTPTGSVIATSQLVDATTMPPSFGLVEFAFSSPLVLPAGQYFFVFAAEPGVVGSPTFQYADGQNIPGEQIAYTSDSGSSWTPQASEDFLVQLKTPVNLLSWSEDAYVSLPGLDRTRNTILPDSIALNGGKIAYVKLNQLPGGVANLTPQIAEDGSVSLYDKTIFILARNHENVIHVGDGGNAITSGKSKILDISGNADKQDKNLKLIEGGLWSFVGGDLTWSAKAFIQIEGRANTLNGILASTKTIADGEVAYVNLNRIPGDDADLTVIVDDHVNILDKNLDAFIIARRLGDEVYIGSGSNRLADGESTYLDKSNLLVTKAKLIGGGDWSAISSSAPVSNGATPNTHSASISTVGQGIGHTFIASGPNLPYARTASISKDGLTGHVRGHIYGTSGGVPDTLLYTSLNTFDETELSNFTGGPVPEIEFLFPPTALTPGGTYAFVVVLEARTSGQIQVVSDNLAPDPLGVTYRLAGGWSPQPNQMNMTIPVSSEDFSWSEDAYVSLPGLTNGRNTILADSLELADDEVVYVSLNTLPGIDDDLALVVNTIDAIPSDDKSVFIIARRLGGTYLFGNSLLTLGETKKLDYAGNANKQDKNLKLIEGGDWNLSSGGVLSWSAAAYVQIEGMLDTRNTIPIGSQAIADGEVIYANVNRISGDPDNLTVAAASIEAIANTNLDAFILARRVGDNLYLGAGGNRLALGDTAQIDKPEGGDPSYKIKTFSAPNLSLKGGSLRTDDGFILMTGSGTDRNTVGVDITIDLDAVFVGTPVNDTTYYLYVDRDKLGDAVVLTDSGESIYNVEEAQFSITHMSPDILSPFRFIHVETLRYGTGAWENAYDAPRFLPDSVGGFFDTVQVHTEIISTATSAQYPHPLDARPALFTVEYLAASGKFYPLDESSHIIDVTDTYIEVDTSTLSFGSGEKVYVRAYRYPATQISSISNEFNSPWFTDDSVLDYDHGMVDAQDIRDYEVQEWDVVAGKIRNIGKDSLVVEFDDTKIYFDWIGLAPTSDLRYRVVGGRSTPVTSVPLRYGGYTRFVGMGPGSYINLTAAVAAAQPGDSILVARSEENTVPVDINVNDIKIEFMPNVVIKVAGGTADGIIVSGDRVDLIGLSLEGDQNAVMTNLLRVSGDDANIERTRIHVNDANLTVTNAVNIEGNRNYVTASVRTTLGALTNSVVDGGTDNDYSVRG